MEGLLQQKKAHDLFKRYEGNPILTPEDWPYPTNAVFNPAAVKLNTETLLLTRVEDMRGFSHLTIARSSDGFTNWEIDAEPTLEADQSSREEKWGLSNLRLRIRLSAKAARWFLWRLRRTSGLLPGWGCCCRRKTRIRVCFRVGSGVALP
jgi:hypothetical protein